MQPEVSPAEAARLLEAGEATIVDVRRDEEWSEGHIPGAVHIPLDELSGRAGELGGGPVVFHCRGGDRQLMAAQAYRASGGEAATMTGGIVAWEDEGRPVER